MSVNSSKEAEILNEITSHSGFLNKIWLGGEIYCKTAGTDKFTANWIDGTEFTVSGQGSSAVTKSIDNKGNIWDLDSVVWADNHPINTKAGNYYPFIASDGKWYTETLLDASVPYYITESDFELAPVEIPETSKAYNSKADLVAGGMFGLIGAGSTITRCSVALNGFNIDVVSPLNTEISGSFAGINNGTVDSSLAVNVNGNTYTVCENKFGEQNGTVNEQEISLLDSSKDTSGIKYGVGNITYDNLHQTEILRNCRVEKCENKNISGDVKIPSYVYDGRAISAVTMIVDGAFVNCIGITSIHLGSLVTEVGDGILTGCSGLTKITIGKSLASINEYNSESNPPKPIFGLSKSGKLVNQYKLAEYEVEDGNQNFKSIDGVLFATQYIPKLDKTVEICVIDAPACKGFDETYKLPETVVRIAPYAFAYSEIKSVELDYVRAIGDYAFLNASLLETVKFAETDENADYNLGVQELVDAGIIYYQQIIGTEAFANCIKLKDINLDSAFITAIGDRAFLSIGDRTATVTIGRGIKYIGENAFGSAENSNYPTKFEAYSVHPDNKRYLSIDGVLYEKLENGTLKLLHYPILNNGDGNGSFTIPTVNDKGEAVSVSVIEHHAFYKSEKLYNANIDLVGIGEIGDYAFANCKLISLTVGSGVKSIGYANTDGETSVFSACNDLEEIIVDENNVYYTDIDGVLFNADVTELIRYPAGRNVNSYKVPETVSEVWDNAFYASKYLTFVSFTSRLSRLGSNPFDLSPNLKGIYFKDCYIPLSYGQDPLKTGNNSTVIYYSNGYYNNNGTNLGWKNFEGKYTLSEYVPPFLQNGQTPRYYTIAVMDQNGLPLDDVYVAMVDPNGNLDAADTVDGVRVFTDTYDKTYNIGFEIGFEKPYKLYVKDRNGDFFPYENTEFYLDEETRITYITLSSVPTVSGSSVTYQCKPQEDVIDNDLWAGGMADINYTLIQGATYAVDINSEVAKINTKIVEKIKIKVACTADKGSSIVDYRLLQGDKVLFDYSGDALKFSEDTYRALEFSVATKNLKTETDIFAEVTFTGADGTKSVIKENLNIQILELEIRALDLSWASNEINLTIDKSIPVIGGAKIKLDKINNLKVNIAVGPDYFRILIGDFGNEDINLKNQFFESNYDRHWGQIFTKDNSRRLWESDNVDKIGLTAGGYIEIKYKGIDENGKPDFDLKSEIHGEAKYTYSDGITRTIWVIPVRLEYKLELSAEATFELSYDFDENKLYSPDLDFNMEGEFNAYAGVGCKLVSAGVYGSVTSQMKWNVLPTFNLKKWTLKGDVGAYVKYNGLFLKFEKKWSLFELLKWNNEWVIYDENNGGWWLNAIRSASIQQWLSGTTAQLYDQSNYVIADGTQAGDYSGIQPQLITLDNENVLVVYADNVSTVNGYDNYNYQKLVYSIYNTKTATYTEPQIIDDIRDANGNGYADGMFELYKADGKIYLAYTQMRKRLTAEDSEDITGYVSSLDVKTAVWNNTSGKFEGIGFVNQNGCYDTSLTMGMVDGAPAVVWLQNDENSINGTTNNNNISIVCSRYVNGSWVTKTVKNNLQSITDISVNNSKIAYIIDVNNDLMTMMENGEAVEGYSDKKVVLIDSYGNQISQTADENAYYDVSVVGGRLVYYVENNLYDLETGYSVFENAIAGLPDDYKVLTDENGSLVGIVYSDNMTYNSENGENGSNLFAIFCDNGIWGYPVQITDYGVGNYVTAFDAVSVNGELLLSTLVTRISDEQTSGNGSSNNWEDLENEADLVTYSIFETRTVEYPSGYTTEKAEVVYETIAPNSEITVTVPIKNNGRYVLKADEIELSLSGVGSIVRVDGFYDKNGILLADGLLSGAEGELRFTYLTGEVSSKEPVITVGNDSYALELWYSDLAVSAKQVWLNGRPYIAASVYNLGLVPASTDIKVIAGNQELRTLTTKVLAKGEMEHFLIAVNPDVIREEETIDLILGVEGEYMLGNNSTAVSFITDENMPSDGLIYDVNLDGKINVKDIVRLKKIMAGVTKETRESDINFDGELTAVDLTLLRKMLLTSIFDVNA